MFHAHVHTYPKVKKNLHTDKSTHTLCLIFYIQSAHCLFLSSVHTSTKLFTFRDGAGEDLCAVGAERSHSSGMFLHPPVRPCVGSMPDVCVEVCVCVRKTELHSSTLLTDPLHPYMHLCFNSLFHYFFPFSILCVLSLLLQLSTDFHLPFSNSVSTYNHSLPRCSQCHSCAVILLSCVS